MKLVRKKNTVKDVEFDWFSVGCTAIWPIGAFPTKYVVDRSPMTFSNADSAHCEFNGVMLSKIETEI